MQEQLGLHMSALQRYTCDIPLSPLISQLSLPFPSLSPSLPIVLLYNQSQVEGYGEISEKLQVIKRAVLAVEQKAEEASFVALVGSVSFSTHNARGEGGRTEGEGAGGGDGEGEKCGGIGVQACEEGQRVVEREMRAQPSDVFLLRALATIYSCKSRLSIPSRCVCVRLSVCLSVCLCVSV